MSDLKTKLAQASEKAVTQRKERRARVIKGSHLTETLLNIGKEAGLQFEENNGFYKLTGPAGKNVRIAIAKRGGIVDFLSFTVQSDAVRQISKEEAEQKHLGRVQGRIAFDGTDDETLDAFRKAVQVLLVPAPEPTKPEKAPKAPKIPPVKAQAAEQAVTTPQA